MKKVDALPTTTAGVPKYPWDELLDGSVWLVDPVEEFGAPSIEGFRIQCHTAAKNRGMKVTTRITPEGIYLQAVPRDVSEG